MSQRGQRDGVLDGMSIVFKNAKVIDVLNDIQEIAPFHFFYLDEWFDEELVSGQYTDAPLDVILTDIFENTSINFYIFMDGKVILTPNDILYDKLPKNFFGRKNELLVQDIVKKKTLPVLNQVILQKTEERAEAIRIGKAILNDSRESYYLRGYARIAKTQEVVPNLGILVVGTDIGAITDENGFYEMELPRGVNLIRTKSLGLLDSERKVIMYNDGNFDFELSEGLEQLDEVIVRADTFKNIEDATTGNIQIDSEESKNIPLVLGERDIFQVAKTLPGITSAGEGASGFNVRGGKTDQNLMLLDEAVLYNPSHFFGIFQALNPFTTKAVNIYKGNVPAEYGGRLSSVFDIKTKDGNTENFSGEASIGPVTANLALEIPVKKDRSAIVFGGRGAYSDWILKSLKEESLKNSKASFYDVILKYNDRVNKNNEISTTAYYSSDIFNVTRDSLYMTSNELLSLKWKHKFNKKTTGDLIAYHSKYDFDIGFDGNFDRNFDFGFNVKENGLKTKLKTILDDKHTLDYGGSYKLYRILPGSIRPKGGNSLIEPKTLSKEKGAEMALFISDKYKVTKKLLVDYGIRYSHYIALGSAVQNKYEEDSPKGPETLINSVAYKNNEAIKSYGGIEHRLAIRYFLSSNLSVKASYNKMYQYIHTLSNNTTAAPIDTWKLTDLNIKPQKGHQYSLGLYKNLDAQRYEISLEGFFKHSANVIDFKTTADLLLNDHIETEVIQGEGKSYGVEFLLRKNTGGLNGWLAYSFSRSLYKFDSAFASERINSGAFFPSNFDKPHDISLIANYRFTKRYSLSVNFLYQTGRPVTFPKGKYTYNGLDYAYYSNRNEDRIPDYYRLDIGFNIEGNHKKKKLAHSFWTISVYNVLGRNNPYSVFFVTEKGEVKAYRSSIFAIPVPSITYNFKF